MTDHRPSLLQRAATTLVLLVGASLAACSGSSILSPRGPVAEANRAILVNSLAIMLAIVIPTIIATLAVAWWFRAGNPRARYDPSFVFSGRIEAVVWSIPLLTIMFLGGLIWVGSHRVDPRRPLAGTAPVLEVQVVSLDWKWLFIYPEQGIATVNRLVLPQDRPVRFSLTSASVMNSFFVPQLGSQIYTMNGMRTELNLQADRAGRYRGQSAHFSGDGFADMAFPVDVAPPAAFDAFVARTKQGRLLLDERSYRLLSRQGRARPWTFAAVAPGLFDAVVAQRIAPAAGPRTGRQGNPTVAPK